jgi:predicted GIY-YIG superfamily endonuclease
MYYTYVLLSLKDNNFYIGYSKDVKLRPARLNDSSNQNQRFYLTG